MKEKPNSIHEAVCAAAGWQAYCERCGNELRRVPQLGGASSQCMAQTCIEERIIENERELKREYWEGWENG